MKTKRTLSAAKMIVLVITMLVMAGCTLGQNAPPEPVIGTLQPANNTPIQPQQAGGPTATPLLQVPPTDTPEPELLAAEQITSILLAGTEFRAGFDTTVRVTHGINVSSMSCTYRLVDTGEIGDIGQAVSSTQKDANTIESLFVFQPKAGGTHVITCAGMASTSSGLRAVEKTSDPVLVQAKG